MTSLEKQSNVKEVLYRNCAFGDGCLECDFFDPEDDTDGMSFCAIRDSENLIPCDDDLDMNSAMRDD